MQGSLRSWTVPLLPRACYELCRLTEGLRRRRSINQPSEEAEGNRSLRWAGEKVAELARLRRRRSIVQPNEEADGNRSVRWVGEEVAELARLRRRRSIVQPRVAELARLPWVPARASAQPCKGLHAVCVRPGRKFPLLVRWPNRKSTLGTRVNPPPNPAKGFTESARYQSRTAAAIQSLQDWEVIIT